MRFEQLSLFDLLTSSKKEDLQEFKPSIVSKGEGVYEIHGLIYSVERVEGWIEAINLWAMRPPKDVAVIAERAWVRPDTIEVVYRSRRYNKAWAFGPKTRVSKHKYEVAVFDFCNYEDSFKCAG